MSMGRMLVFPIVLFLAMALVATLLLGGSNNKVMYRNALAKSIYKVLVREDYIDQTQLTEYKFKREIVQAVIPEGQIINSDAEIERQSDLVLRELVDRGYHTQPIAQEYIMNLIKIEYHVANGKTKVGKALQ